MNDNHRWEPVDWVGISLVIVMAVCAVIQMWVIP